MTEIINIIKEVLLWLLPAGGAGGVIVWMFNKKLRTLRTDKEVHDTYKEMYDDVKKELRELRNENKILRKEFARMETVVAILETIFSKVVSCRYYNSCPIRFELSQLQKHQRKPGSGDSGNKRKVRKAGSEDTGIESEPSDTDSESSEPSSRG